MSESPPKKKSTFSWLLSCIGICSEKLLVYIGLCTVVATCLICFAPLAVISLAISADMAKYAEVSKPQKTLTQKCVEAQQEHFAIAVDDIEAQANALLDPPIDENVKEQVLAYLQEETEKRETHLGPYQQDINFIKGECYGRSAEIIQQHILFKQ